MTEQNHTCPQTQGQTLPVWVEEMHEHYRVNGFYRVEDVQRVLGDPRECVSVEATSDVSQLSRNLRA
jgi:hypothetical protein